MKVGFLPLYIALYDEISPSMRPRCEAFYETMAKRLEAAGLEVIRTPICRIKPEFDAAVQNYEEQGADAIVTLHIAYSPSLESIDAICATDLPVIVMDTTETEEFTNMQNPEEISYNHGIHGVMDFCSMMMRRGKPYAIAAGYYKTSDVVERVVGFVRAAVCAEALTETNVALFGGVFEGMGDFSVPAYELNERFGIRTLDVDADRVRAIYQSLTEEEVVAEKQFDKDHYLFEGTIIPEEYDAAVRSGLALRKYIDETGLTAFSVNFTKIGPDNSGLTSMPFIECCKEMTRGIGYAGEGDPLTASFTGAFLRGYPDSTFCEIFCPDWKNDIVMLSHMGEVNYNLAAVKPVIRRAGKNFTPAGFPYAGYTRMKGGHGVYVNVSRGEDDYKVVLSECDLLDFDEDNFPGDMRGWLRPACGTAMFLENLSRFGATHHSTFVMGATAEQIEFFATLLGMETYII